jgi:HTH-type transcriptional regulator/antitoxin HigA
MRIKGLKQYNEYCEVYEELAYLGKQSNQDKIDLLELLIEDFDNKTIEEMGNSKDMDPVELLKYLLEENNLSKSDLARELCVVSPCGLAGSTQERVCTFSVLVVPL